MALSKKAALTECIRKMANEVAPGKFAGRAETYQERLSRILWMSATGYEATMIVEGKEHKKTLLPNLNAAVVVLERCDGKVPSVNADDEAGVPIAPAQPTALTVGRLNALAQVATQQAPDTTVN